MLQIFIAFVLLISGLTNKSWADNKVPDSLEQINADLLAKKTKNDPFNGKEVKVDLESLGLDSIDPKDPVMANPEKEKPIEKPIEKLLEKAAEESLVEKNKAYKQEITKSQLLPSVTKQDEVKSPSLSDRINSAIKSVSPKTAQTQKVEELGAASKIQNFLEKTKSSEPPAKKEDEKKPAAAASENIAQSTDNAAKAKQTYINAEKKRNLKKQLATKKLAQKKAAENEKKRLQKLSRLNELREKYLIKVNSEKSDAAKNFDDDLTQSDEKIIPQKKEINRFISSESMPPPIMNRYRSRDNVNIPIILSLREKTDNLFRSITLEDISYFNSAFSDLENPDARNASGDTILTYAILTQRHEVIASILNKGADPNLANSLGYSPLQIAIEISDFNSFNLLVNANANINYADAFGRTYLMHAARVGFLAGVDLLLEKDVDVNAMDADGFTALSISYKYRKDLITALLLKYGAKTWVEKPYDPETASLMQELENRWKK